MNDRKEGVRMLVCGLGLALVEAMVVVGLLVVHFASGLRLLSMIGACHLGGRLAFIGAGFEGGLSAWTVIGIVTFHNSAILLIIYGLWLFFSERLEQIPFLASLREKVQLRRNLRSRWNLLGIAVFIWVPLPMTGAVVGALLAHFEGYKPRQVLLVALSAMIVGVVSWTLAFEPLYAWMRGIGQYVTTTVTLVLVLVPIGMNLLRKRNSERKLP